MVSKNDHWVTDGTAGAPTHHPYWLRVKLDDGPAERAGLDAVKAAIPSRHSDPVPHICLTSGCQKGRSCSSSGCNADVQKYRAASSGMPW
jgi:hypothetical protein